MSEETIVLPRSGVVLKAGRFGYFRAIVGGLIDASFGYADNGKYQSGLGGRCSEKGTREEALAWLDARVLALRAALLPQDARERVAKALHRQNHGAECVPDSEACFEFERKYGPWLDEADAVLAALGGGA